MGKLRRWTDRNLEVVVDAIAVGFAVAVLLGLVYLAQAVR